MEVMKDDSVETNSCKRQRVSEEELDDRISSLPDNILVHILSFLPIEDAVKTVLVPRFRNLWNFLPSLSFNQCGYHDCANKYDENGPHYNENFLNFVRHVLFLHESATIDKFHLKFELNLDSTNEAAADEEDEEAQDHANREKMMASEVDCWIHFVMRKKVKVLNLDFKGCGLPEPTASYRLPNVVFGGKYLSELKLVACEIKPNHRIQLNCLKRLLLKEIVLEDKIIDQILKGCSLLEELSLICCYGLRRLATNNPNTKSLILDLYYQGPMLQVLCPNVESLEIAGSIDLVDLVDVSSIAVSAVVFSSTFKCKHERYQTLKALFKKLSHGKIFIPCTWCILVFTIWQLINQPGLLFVWKRLEFGVHLTKWHLPGISCLLRTSPYLETLTMYISPGRYLIFTNPESYWMKAHEFDAETFWSSQEGTFHCLKKHLKTIKIYGHITEPYVIDFIGFLLKNAMVLENLEISTQKTLSHSYRVDVGLAAMDRPKNITTEQRLEFSQKLLAFPRASTCAAIHFS